jgi:hypothetical protein
MNARLILFFVLLIVAARADFAPKFTSVDGKPALSIAELAAKASGTQPFTYQWYRNGVALPTETMPIIIITDPKETGTFHAVISNSEGSAKTGTVKFANTYVESAPDVLITRKQKPL